jgi:glycosyltransferase involved in cell wall biosynthesis
MKVALVSPNSLRSFGGAERKLVEAAKLLAERGCEVEIRALPRLHPKHIVDVRKYLEGIDYVESSPCEPKADIVYIVYAVNISFFVKSDAPTIAGLHSPLLFRPPWVSRALLRDPWLYGSLRYAMYCWFAKDLMKLEVRRFDAVRALTRANSIKHKRVFVLSQWVNTGIFKPHTIKDDSFTVLFAGRHHWEKGWDIFLHVASELKNKGYNIKFVCTGDGTGSVKGLGFLNDKDLAEAFSKAHVTLYPSRADTFGNVIVESMACGTPVITTAIPAHEEIGGPLMFARPRLDEFTRKLIEFYVLWKEHPDVYRKLSQKSVKWAQKYSVNVVFPHFLYMLKAVADRYKG